MNAPDRLPYRTLLMADLLAAPAGAQAADDPNRVLLASLLAGQAAGDGGLPAHLGLGDEACAAMRAEYFENCPVSTVDRQIEAIPEWSDLQKLLLDHRAGERASELWMADILATACAGRDHLWQDLGFTGRDELTRLMNVNFPALAHANTGDMKWKKFLYRRFCSLEGIYTCPAPSCGVCQDFAKCFGPEN